MAGFTCRARGKEWDLCQSRVKRDGDRCAHHRGKAGYTERPLIRSGSLARTALVSDMKLPPEDELMSNVLLSVYDFIAVEGVGERARKRIEAGLSTAGADDAHERSQEIAQGLPALIFSALLERPTRSLWTDEMMEPEWEYVSARTEQVEDV